MKRFFFLLITLAFSISGIAQEKKAGEKIPEGYGSITWGTRLSAAKDNIKGKLVFTDEKTTIISKEGELYYNYGFFYIDKSLDTSAEMQMQSETRPQGEPVPAAATAEKQDEGKLFFVILKFPYLAMKDVKEKIEAKYGTAKIENITENQGAIGWTDDKTIIVMWVDRYEGKPYCRRISYVSKDVAKEVNDYNYNLFFKTEIDVIKKLNP